MGTQQVNITLFEENQHISVSAFCNSKVGLKNYKMLIPPQFYVYVCPNTMNALFPKKLKVFTEKWVFSGKNTYHFREKGGGLDKENSHTWGKMDGC